MALTNLQRVRILIHDPSTGAGNTDNADGTGDPNFSDAEITDFLSLYSDETVARVICFYTASDLCYALQAKSIERSTMLSAGGTFVEDAKKIAVYWGELAERLYERAVEAKSGNEEGPAFDVAEINASGAQTAEILNNRLYLESI